MKKINVVIVENVLVIIKIIYWIIKIILMVFFLINPNN